MRRGSISLGNIICDECHKAVGYSERYLAVDEKDGGEVEKGDVKHYCVACAERRGYARQEVQEKDEKVVTFLPKY